MRGILLRWILLSLAVWGAASAVPEHVIAVRSVWSALLAVVVIGLLNALVKPLLFFLKIITLPVNFLTLGLFSLVVSFCMNAVIFWAVGQQWLPGFAVKGVAGAAAGAAIMAVVNSIVTLLIADRRR